MNAPNSNAPQSNDKDLSSHQSYSTDGTFPRLNNVMSSVQSTVPEQQSYMEGSHILQPAISHRHLTAHQQQFIGLPIANPMVVSSLIAPTPPNNVVMTNMNAFSAYMQQQPGTGILTMGVNPFMAHNDNSFVIPSSTVTNPLQGMHSSQLIGRNVQWQSVVVSGTNVHNVDKATTISYNYTGKNGGNEGVNDYHNNDDERIQTLRDRNRVNSRSARQKKKAYVHQLQSLVESLHKERNEEMHKRTVAAQRNVDIEKVRRRVMVTFLNYHSRYQTDPRKWSSILEGTFWLKQPITPFRSFRGSEIENVRY